MTETKPEPTLPAKVVAELKDVAKDTNKLDTTLRNGTLVAAIPGTSAGRAASRLGIEITEKASN
jgi:hypothetical protein